jgi:ubiquinone/menaquinone biosynthesis C-methylase UbiE
MLDLTPAEAKHWREHYADNAKFWEKWAEPMAEQQDKVNQFLLDAAKVAEGSRVLDLASGAGEPAITAAKRVGEAGAITVTDIAGEMVDGVKRRAAKLGLRNISFEVTPMERLPFADLSFDAVICRYGLMYSTDPGSVWKESARVLKSGGRAAHLVWGPEQNNAMVWTVMRAANEAWGKRLSDTDLERPLRFAVKGSLTPLILAAGLDEATEQEIEFQPRIKVGVPFWLPLIEINAGHIWSDLSTEMQERTKTAVLAALEPLRDGEIYRFKTHMRLAVGVKI